MNFFKTPCHEHGSDSVNDAKKKIKMNDVMDGYNSLNQGFSLSKSLNQGLPYLNLLMHLQLYPFQLI